SASFPRNSFLSSDASISLAATDRAKCLPRTPSTDRATSSTRAGRSVVAPSAARPANARRARVCLDLIPGKSRVACPWSSGAGVSTLKAPSHKIRRALGELSEFSVNEFAPRTQRNRPHPDVAVQPFREHRDGPASLRQTAGGLRALGGDPALDLDGAARGSGQRHQAWQRSGSNQTRSLGHGRDRRHASNDDPRRGGRLRPIPRGGSAGAGEPDEDLRPRHLLYEDLHG